jgi:hypothetical protein
LFDFVAELIFAALKLGARDDLVVDAGNDLFDDLAGSEDRQKGQSNKDEANFLHKYALGHAASRACR